MDKAHAYRGAESLILDLDSSHADIYGDQKEPAFNAYYGTVGFHPLEAFEGMTGDFLKAKLRLGNEYTSNEVVPFILPVIKHYNETFPETTPFLLPTAALRCQLYTNSGNRNLFLIRFV